MTPEVVGKISHLAIHPIKGAHMMEVDRALLTPEGLAGDREFMVVRAVPDADGVYNFVTQRDKRNEQERQPQGFSALVLIKPEIRGDTLRLTWEEQDPIDVPTDRRQGRELSIRVWNHVTNAVDQGDELAEWLSDHLQADTRLVRAAGSFQRMANQNYLPNNNAVRFQDGYPVHWFVQESVDELATKAGQEITWRRFRPNMVAEGGEPQVEHVVFRGKVGGVEFVQPKPCDRCPVTTVDQDTGQKIGGEPLKTLATYKKWRNNRGELKVIFGENMLPLGTGEIRVGDEIVLFERRNPPLVYGAKA